MLGWLLAGLATIASAPDPIASLEPVVAVAAEDPVRPTPIELGVAVGDYVYTVGSLTQLHYAPTFDLRLAYGLSRIGALGFIRVATPIELAGSIGRTRQVGFGGGFGLRSMFVRRPRVEFGMSLTTMFDRLDSRTRLPALPGLDEPEHVQHRVTHHVALALGNELGFPLPTRRGPRTVITLGSALAFGFPIAASRRGSDVAETHYGAQQLGVIGVLGGATVVVQLGVTLGWPAG